MTDALSRTECPCCKSTNVLGDDERESAQEWERRCNDCRAYWGRKLHMDMSAEGARPMDFLHTGTEMRMRFAMGLIT